MKKKTATRKASSHPTAQTPNLIVSEPISVLQRDLKADGRGLFKALGKSVVHIGTGKFWELGGDVAEAAAALGLKTDPGGLTWYLIHRSLQKAMLALVDEAWLHRKENSPPPTDEMGEKLDREISKAKLEVSADFFLHPGGLAFIHPCTDWFREWLVSAGFDTPKANSISSRLRSYFVYGLNQEWRAHPELYAPILSAATTPFTAAAERDRAWKQYCAWLDQDLDSPLFGEPFSLRQLYVPLRAYFHRIIKKEEAGSTSGSDDSKKKRVAVDLTTTLIEWVKKKEKDDAIRIICGGPGSGKSSAAKMFASGVLTQTEWPALYIPLHRIKYKGEIISAVHDYLKAAHILPGASTPLDPETGEKQILLIFDGLDELAMLGKIAQETVNGFVRAVKDLVRDQNTTSLRMKVILTGRTVVMQNLETEFRNEGVLLHLCPYFVPDEKKEKELYIHGWKLLSENDQRQQWWRKYGELTGNGYTGLPDQFNRDGLVEVSSEPLLNYLLAIADQAQTLDFTKEVTENHIYASLIHEVYDRRWSDGQHFSVQGMSEDHFQRVLEEIAVAAWHGDGRKTTVGEIKQHCHDAGITKMLDIFQDGAESGVLRLLTAFFFRQSGERSDENAFEFTHKSFGEFLVARSIARLMGLIEMKSEEQRTRFSGWDERECLEKWARLCGPTALNQRQWGFLKNEMHREGAKPETWQSIFVTLINAMLRTGMPMEKLGLLNYQSMRDQARNAEEALLIAVNACALAIREISVIDWPEPVSAGKWIKFLQGQRTSAANVIAMDCLSWIDMSHQALHIVDFYGADLRDSNLYDSSMHLTQLTGANLNCANLSRANLASSNLRDAKLSYSNLHGAKLHQAYFQQALLDNANLEQVDLSRADLRGACLKGGSLIGANLSGANFSEADLSGADLRDVNLEDVDLSRANTLGAFFE